MEVESHLPREGAVRAWFEAGTRLLAARAYAQAWPQLEAAAAAGHAGAECRLASLLHYGRGCAADPPAAMARYERAAAAGDGEAALRLAITRLHGRWLQPDPLAIATQLLRGARAAEPQVLRALELLALDQPSIPRWSGADASAEASALQAALLDWLRAPLHAESLHAAPAVRTVAEVLGPAMRADLVARAQPRLQPAQVINPHTRAWVRDPARNNQSAPLGTGGPDLVLALAEYRLARLAELPLAHAEYAAVLRYAPGEEYRPHRDYLVPQAHPDQFLPSGAGQRIRTVCAYLNTVEGGGETEFPQLGIRVRPVAGQALVFDNVDAQGVPEPRSLHAGRAVTSGEKWLATLWFRERPLRAA